MLMGSNCRDCGAIGCRTAQSFGWAASTDVLLLFYPVPRNTFLHWLFNTDFPGLVKYHRYGMLGLTAVLGLEP